MMPTFPLPKDIFPRVDLSTEDSNALSQLARVVVEDTLKQRQEFYESDKGHVDKRLWKKLKQNKNVKVYRQRRAAMESSMLGPLTIHASTVPGLFTVGSVSGRLDSVMYGVMSDSFDSMRIRTSYIHDHIVDCAVLAKLGRPTRDDPFKSLVLKWAVKGPRSFARLLVRFRDCVYLEATGVITTDSGERVGYHVHHSVDVPGVRELTEFDLVRAKSSHCFLYSQGDDETVNVFGSSHVDLLGNMNQAYASSIMASSLVSVSRLVDCAELKKLMWLLKTSEHAAPISEEKTHWCVVCRRTMDHAPQLKKACHMCRRQVCSTCRETRRLSFISSRSNNLVQHDMTFCQLCLAKAGETSAESIALYENASIDKLIADTNVVDLEATLSPTVSDGGLLSVTGEFESDFEWTSSFCSNSTTSFASTTSSNPIELTGYYASEREAFPWSTTDR